MALTQITTHAVDAVARLLSQYRDKPRIAGLVSALAGRGQAVENALWSILTQLALSTAADAWLDRLGAIVGEPRDGRTDVVYRASIRARIYANASNGRVEDLIAMFQAWADWVGPGLPLKVTQLAPAAISVDTSPGGGAIASVEATLLPLFRLFSATRAAGVGMTVRYQLHSDPDGMFRFATTGAPESTLTEGFSDGSPLADGGHWAGAVRC